MKINHFDQFEAYQAGLIHADLRLMLPRMVQSRWEIATQSVGSIEFQFGMEGSGIIAEGAVHQGGQTLFVPMAGLQFANGQPLEDHRVFVPSPGGELTIASKVPHDWCSIFFPFDGIHRNRICDAFPSVVPSSSQVIEIGNEAMSRLRGLLLSLYQSLRVEPALSRHPATQKSIQTELLAACEPIGRIHARPNSSMGRPPINRRKIFKQVMTMIEKDEGGMVSIDDLIRSANVSERSLRNIFLDYVGLPPKRFLVVRRLHRARAILKRQSAECTSVTEVAAQCGFWHFGRFAGEYRRLFGELPSQTLHSPPNH
jgi:AraC family ethanolamine operon transcriptional activator